MYRCIVPRLRIVWGRSIRKVAARRQDKLKNNWRSRVGGDMAEEKKPFFGAHSEAPEQQPLYREAKDMSLTKLILGGFLGFVAFNIVLSIIMVSVQAARENKLFVLLLVSLLAFAQVEVFMVFFIYRGHLPKENFWWIYVIGICVIIEAIGTDIIVFTL